MKVGLEYPEIILAFKLLRSSNIKEEGRAAVFEALQSNYDLVTGRKFSADLIDIFQNVPFLSLPNWIPIIP